MTCRIIGITAGLFLLAGCAENLVGDPVTEEVFYTNPGAASAPLDATGSSAIETSPIATDGAQGVDPALAMVEATPGSDGLLDREPDTCKMSDYLYLQGQNTSALQSAGITRSFRVVGPNDIVTQEYNPMRVNFYADGSGRIGRISCG